MLVRSCRYVGKLFVVGPTLGRFLWGCAVVPHGPLEEVYLHGQNGGAGLASTIDSNMAGSHQTLKGYIKTGNHWHYIFDDYTGMTMVKKSTCQSYISHVALRRSHSHRNLPYSPMSDEAGCSKRKLPPQQTVNARSSTVLQHVMGNHVYSKHSCCIWYIYIGMHVFNQISLKCRMFKKQTAMTIYCNYHV